MEEEHIQDDPTRILVQDLVLLLIFCHRVVFFFFGGSLWLRDREIFLAVNTTRPFYNYILETVLVTTHRLNNEWKNKLSCWKIIILPMHCADPCVSKYPSFNSWTSPSVVVNLISLLPRNVVTAQASLLIILDVDALDIPKAFTAFPERPSPLT